MKNRSLRIAMLSIHSSPDGDLGTRDTGGMSVYVRELAAALGRGGHLVDIYTLCRPGERQQTVALAAGVRLVRLDGGPAAQVPKAALHAGTGAFFQAMEDVRHCTGTRYDLIHSNYWLSGCVGRVAQQCWAVPHVITFHTLAAVKNSLGVGPAEPGVRLRAEQVLAAECQAVIAPSARERGHLVRLCNAQPQNVPTVPCGVDPVRFSPIEKARARRAIGCAPEVKLVLFVGRFDPLKGIDLLLQATACLRDHAGLQVRIIGGSGPDDAARQGYETLARRLNISDRVVFAGRVAHERLARYYSAADVCVLPSRYESFGMVGLESLCCGTPVVAAQVGAMDEIIRPGDTGRVLDHPEPQALARAVGELLALRTTDPFAPARIRETVQHCTWDRAGAATADLYQQVLRRWKCCRAAAACPGSVVRSAVAACHGAQEGTCCPAHL